MEFEIRHGYDSSWIDMVLEIHNKTEMKRNNKEKVDTAFKNSFAVASCWAGGQLVGIGRMISDGQMYSSIFDLVVDPQYQKKGFGRKIMEALVMKAPDTCIYLTSTFGNEPFYYNLGFKKHRTAMAKYPKAMSASQYLDHDWKPGT
jgi:GNAT superfamily N-acetyltransferase